MKYKKLMTFALTVMAFANIGYAGNISKEENNNMENDKYVIVDLDEK